MNGWNLLTALEPERIRNGLDEVLQRPEFRSPKRPGWMEDLIHGLQQFFDLLGWLHATLPLLFWLLIVGSVLLLVLLVARLVWKVRGTFYVPDAAARVAAERRGLLSAGYGDEALRRAAAGDFTEAIRCLFLSLVYRLDESGRVGFQKAYTNHEYLDLVADHAGVRDTLRIYVDTLDEYWYGQRQAGAEQYQRCLALYEEMR
jgi:hypothetical protein